jgi:diguanylate cyclase (GGDEF)-like protein
MKRLKFDDFEKKYSPVKLLLILVLSILICDLSIGYLSESLVGANFPEKIFIDSILLVLILSPVLYVFLYRPLSKQFDKLKQSEVVQRQLSLIDELTGIYNRRGFLLHANYLLKLSRRTQRGLAIIYGDLNGMKSINDNFGHEDGDKALIFIAKVLQETFRGSDVAGRIGGDEFAVISIDAKSENLNIMRKRINRNLMLALRTAGFKYDLNISLGIVYYDPEKDQTIEELLNKADKLMYEDKKVEFPA